MNGLQVSDVSEPRRQEVLEALLKESEDFYKHTRCQQVHATIPELSRYFYRSMLESKDSVKLEDTTSFSLDAQLTGAQFKALKDSNTVEIKVEFPLKAELKNLLKTAQSAVKKLEAKKSSWIPNTGVHHSRSLAHPAPYPFR